MNRRILSKTIGLPDKQEDYDKFHKLVKILMLFYPSLVFQEEGSNFTVYSDYLDNIDNFILILNKLINYPSDEFIILNMIISK